MSIDFSTITPYGIIALIIICVALYLILRSLKNLKIKTEKATLEIGKSAGQIQQSISCVKEESANTSRDIVKKQSNLAKHHILTMGGDLEKLFSTKYDLTEDEKNIVHLLINLFLSELKYQVLNNFTENHIGKNDIEIQEYARIREREYRAFARTFVNSYGWLIPKYNFLDCFDDIPDGYLFSKLYTIYRDGKELERHIKKGGN
jgi:hypothetical protein